MELKQLLPVICLFLPPYRVSRRLWSPQSNPGGFSACAGSAEKCRFIQIQQDTPSPGPSSG